jgi:tetratricopeptide (TPR) repeat protein
VWERAKAPELLRYCDLLAGATSKLAGTSVMAQAALASAREADETLPGHGAPLVLEGRALSALGQFDEALAALRAGRDRDPGALDEPAALYAWARVLSRTGHVDEAAEAYRALLPRTAPLSAAERSSAAVQAGLVLMARGPAGLDDAIAALREALREGQDEAQTVAAYALALALDRRGDADEARALAAARTHGDPRSVFEGSRAKELVAATPAEALAMSALALAPLDAAGARDAWTQYLAASPNGPFASHARAHLATLAPGAAARRGTR